MPTFLLRLLFLPLILLLVLPSSSSDVCPDSCSCQSHGNVFCIHRRSPAVPRGLPAATRGLYVFQNGIGALARDDFAGLALLDMLDLSQNELADLPDGVFEPLSALRNLDLSSNAIVRVARGSFSGLAGLERLYLHGNRIRSIEADAFEGLKGLLELKLQGNQLTALPALRLPRLLLLDLSSNRLPTLGPAELQTPHLESLKVAALGLTSLDEELMASLGNLHDLDVSENELREVPRSLWAARGLIKLSLAANPLRDLGREGEEEEGGLGKMAALQELDLSGLNINELPRAFLQLFPRLAVLTAAENPFNCLCALAWLPGWLRERGVALGRPEETRCHFPPVNAGRTLAELERHDFGCPPTTTLATSATGATGGGGGGEEEWGRWSTPPSPTTASPEAWYTAAPPPPPSEEPPSTGAEFDVPRPPAPGGGGGEQEEEDGEGHICPANICLNGGTCRFDGHGQLACVCPAATSGHYCENLDEDEEEVERKEEEEVRRPFLPEEDAAAASVAPAAAVTAEHDDISSRQVTSTSILLDLHRFIETRPRIRGIKLTYRNLSGPDLRPVHLSVPASYPQYTLRGLRPNCTYSVCASPLGDRGGAAAAADGGGRGSCVEARTAGVQASSSEPQVVGPDPLAYALVPALAALALVLGAALAAGAVVFVRRRRRRRAKDGAPGQDELGGPAELSPLELEGVKACLENGGGGTVAGLENGGGGGSEAERSRAPVRPPSPQGGGLEYEVPLMRGQGHCSSNNNVDAMKPSYF